MQIREAVQTDNDQLLGLQKKSPMGSDLVLQLDSSPDFFNRSKGYMDWNIIVAEENSRILGAASYAVQEKPIQGVNYSMVYEYEFMVDPDARRRGIASKLQQEIENRTPDADYYHLNITEDNVASHSFFTKMGFTTLRACAPYMVMAYREEAVEGYKVRQAREGDIPVIVELLNETYRDYEMYPAFTYDSLIQYIERLPYFELTDLYIHEQDTVLAVAGFWDYDKVMKFTMLGFNTRWRLMRFITNTMRLFTDMPYMPGIGEQMTNAYLMLLGYRDSGAGKNLVGHILNTAREKGIGMVSLPLDKESHTKEVLDGFRYGEGSFNWYMKSNKGLDLPDPDKVFFVDPKDV